MQQSFENATKFFSHVTEFFRMQQSFFARESECNRVLILGVQISTFSSNILIKQDF